MREPQLRYDWLQADSSDPELGDYSAIKALRYWPDDFLAETRFQNVQKVVHVQAAIGTPDPVAETAWLQGFADRIGIPQGIVAYVDLADRLAEETLHRHAQFANLRGIRDLRYDDYLTDEAWLLGYGLLESLALVFCDDPRVNEMSIAATVASRFPDITYCIDHAGYPRQRDHEYFLAWRHGMSQLAAVDNTVAKISGLGMGDHRWTVESLRPWVSTVIELFGCDRAFFGSNWPVDRLYSSYGDVLDAYNELVSDLTADERGALLHGNANRIFRLS